MGDEEETAVESFATLFGMLELASSRAEREELIKSSFPDELHLALDVLSLLSKRDKPVQLFAAIAALDVASATLLALARARGEKSTVLRTGELIAERFRARVVPVAVSLLVRLLEAKPERDAASG